jgi:Tol biopolymer transport system component
MNSDGTDATQFTSVQAFEPAWSHDGGAIVFSARPCGTFSCPSQIYVMHADGSGITQLTTAAAASYAPRWSPDDARITFNRGSELWIMNADGSEQKLVQSEAYGGEWSPDGTRIVFYSDRRWPTPWWNGYEPYELYTVHPEGKGLVRITTVTPSTGGSCDQLPDQTYEPRWSLDGKKIAFLMRGDPWCIYDDENVPHLGMALINPDGSGYTRLVPGDYGNFEIEGPPIWSPDSAHITYAASGATFVVDVAGGPERRLNDYPPPSDWQPLPVNTPSAFPRPRGATPIYASLVPAFAPCASPNSTHGAPLSFGSCGPLTRESSNLTVGAPDANGRRANSVGFVQLRVHTGAPGGADDSDVLIDLQVTSVYKAADLSDYGGELEARTSIRRTDKEGGVSSTTIDFPLSVAVPCTPTADPDSGANCALNTSADAIRPGLAPEGRRSNWALGQAQVYDGGADGLASTPGDNELFQVEGLFVP